MSLVSYACVRIVSRPLDRMIRGDTDTFMMAIATAERPFRANIVVEVIVADASHDQGCQRVVARGLDLGLDNDFRFLKL